MLYMKSNTIRKKDIKDMFAFRSALTGYGLIESKNSFIIFMSTKDSLREDIENLLERLSYIVKSEIIIKVGGLDKDSNIVADAYVGDKKGFTRYDTFEYCLSTKNGIRIFK